jgi:hypothetical protein
MVSITPRFWFVASVLSVSIPFSQAMAQEQPEVKTWRASFLSIFHGPPVGKLQDTWQPTPQGERSLMPVLFRNYASVNWTPDQNLELGVTQYFVAVPVLGTQFAYRDPYLRLGVRDLLPQTVRASWAADLRLHVPVSSVSRGRDMVAGLQTYHNLSTPLDSARRLSAGVVASGRVNFYGSQGLGSDLELYVGPTVGWQASQKLGFSLTYDWGASHWLGEPAGELISDGTDIQPAVSWDVTPELNVSPFLNLYTGKNTNLKGSSIGFTLSLQLI